MSPNQPKTPISSFRLTPETRASLDKIAQQYQTSMTGAISALSAAMVPLRKIAEVAAKENSTYPIEAYEAAGMAYRQAMGLQEGDILDEATMTAIDRMIAASNPIIREEQETKTLNDVIRRLEFFGASPDLIDHIRSLRDS